MPPARKTAAKRPAATSPDGTPLPEFGSAKGKKPPVAMEDAFTLGGKVYAVPVEIPAQVAIRYMDHCRKKGENWGLSWLLEEVLGTTAYEAVLEADLEDDDLIAIAKIVQSKVLGDGAPKDSRRR